VPDLSRTELFNFNYTVSGDYNITPIKIFDDGQFTYMEFRNKNAILPAVFSVDSNGYESIVNFRIVDKYLAIESISSVFTLRYGADTVCVFNETLRGISRNLQNKK
jgi:type IV secretion system protein VirB9